MTFPHPPGAVLASDDATRFISEHGYIYRDDERVSHTLKCSICSEPWLDPVQADPCGHIFCSVCIATWTSSQPTCPVDRTRLSVPDAFKPPLQILRELVDELPVLCSLGCGWSGRRDAWKAHLERECEEVEVNGQSRRSVATSDKGKGKEEVEMRDEELHGVDEDEDSDGAMTPPPVLKASLCCSSSDRDVTDVKAVKRRERALLRRIGALKAEAQQSAGTIDAWKGKVIKLEAQLADAIRAEATVHEPGSPTVRASSWSGRRSAMGLDAHDSGMGGGSSRSMKGDAKHPAKCDQCRDDVRGMRYKCFKCPDFDLCQKCVDQVASFHPGHDFAPIRDPRDVDVRSLPEWKTPHPGVTCDWCRKSLVGPRFRCTVCPNFDLCHKCIADPGQPHNKRHPMIRYLVPDTPSARRPFLV